MEAAHLFRGPRWAGAMLSENRKLVYAGNRHNDIHYRSLPKIHFTASGVFLKTFDRFVRFCLCDFVSIFFFFFFFFVCESTHYEKQKKKT